MAFALGLGGFELFVAVCVLWHWTANHAWLCQRGDESALTRCFATIGLVSGPVVGYFIVFPSGCDDFLDPIIELAMILGLLVALVVYGTKAAKAPGTRDPGLRRSRSLLAGRSALVGLGCLSIGAALSAAIWHGVQVRLDPVCDVQLPAFARNLPDLAARKNCLSREATLPLTTVLPVAIL